jgi:selenocysteine lyase/cysteine desulfurase
MAGYFDTAASSGRHLDVVKDTIYKLMKIDQGSLGRNQCSYLNVDGLRDSIKQILGVGNSWSICFSASATEALNTILKGIFYKDGEIVFHTPFCHNSVLRPLYYLKKERRINLLQIPFESFLLDCSAFRELILCQKPRLVVFPVVGNVFGNVLPSIEICKIIREICPQTIIVADCAQAAGLIDLSTISMFVDFIVFAGHKTLLGLPGCSGFAMSGRVVPNPLIHGGSGIESESHDNPINPPERYEVGTKNLYAMAALDASAKWILSKGVDNLYIEEKSNKQKLLNILAKYSFIHPILPIGQNLEGVGIISALSDYLSVSELSQVLFEHGVTTRSGFQCAPLAHKHIGTDDGGTIRFSVNALTTDADFEMLNDALNFVSENI